MLAESARVDSAKVQVDSAQAIFQQASDRFTAGLSAKIDMTRSQVELQTQQQRLTAEQADYAKQKIGLARLIGLSPGQIYSLADKLPYAPLENITLEQALALAAQNRSDLKAAEAQVHAAEFARKAAVAEHYPTLGIVADYGVIGINPANSHGTFDVSGQLLFPIWAGGHTHGDIVEADATLKQRRAEYESVRARVEADVRNAYLDLNAAAELVRVAQSRRELARDELTQSTDRFSSGVADTVEVDAGPGSGGQRGVRLHRQSECPQPGQGQRGARDRPGRKNHARSFEEPITMAVDQLQQPSAPRPAEPAGKSNEPNEAGQQRRGAAQDAAVRGHRRLRDSCRSGFVLAVFPHLRIHRRRSGGRPSQRRSRRGSMAT